MSDELKIGQNVILNKNFNDLPQGTVGIIRKVEGDHIFVEYRSYKNSDKYFELNEVKIAPNYLSTNKNNQQIENIILLDALKKIKELCRDTILISKKDGWSTSGSDFVFSFIERCSTEALNAYDTMGE